MKCNCDVNYRVSRHILVFFDGRYICTSGCCNKLEKILGLYATQSTTNMNLFDAHEKLKKYANIYDIIEDYYVERLDMYSKRKAAILAQLSNELRVLSNRAKYIQEILDDKLDMRR